MGMDITMKGEKTEGSKNTIPLFPRIHVNDMKKIGTRAPPRNKMALYDQQLSISSPNLNTTITTSPTNGRTLTDTSSSSQCVIGTKRSMFSPYNNSSASIHANARQPLYWFEGIQDSMPVNFPTISSVTNSNENVNLPDSPLPKLDCSSISLEQSRPPINANKVISFMSIGLDSEHHVKKSSDDNGLDVPETSARHDKSMTPMSEARDSELDEADIIKAQDHMELSKQENKVCRGDAINDEETKVSIISNASVMRSDSSHASIITDLDHQTLKVENGNQLEVKERPNSSAKDSVSGRSVISSEALMKLMGYEEFQKAKNLIIHQQRVFSMQVYELHKLIRVQKMIAGSGNIQHTKDCVSLGKELLDPTSMKHYSPKSIPEATSWHTKSKNGVATTKVTAEDKPPPLLLSLNSDTANLAATSEQISKHTNSNLPMWYLSPAGNQWLLPVISPSEGLIYKPYPIPPPLPPPPPPPLPPPGGLLSTLYNDIGPSNSTPYGMHLLNNPFFSTTTAPFKMTTNSNNFATSLYQTSCNMDKGKDIEKMEILPSNPKKMKNSFDVLQLFPTSPSTSLELEQPIQSYSNEQKTEVIKVIPHNPKLASESAARIVQFIQEERKHCCN